MKEKKKIIFVCTHNSARSQMAEGILRSLYGDYYGVYSAGTSPSKVHPLSIQAMSEIGIDISGQKSKGLDELAGIKFDLAVTVCGPQATCPFVPGAGTIIHQEFDDPSESPDLDTFRRVRDEIFVWIKDVFSDPAHMPILPQMPLRLL